VKHRHCLFEIDSGFTRIYLFKSIGYIATTVNIIVNVELEISELYRPWPIFT
jgi:hypothetical protein